MLSNCLVVLSCFEASLVRELGIHWNTSRERQEGTSLQSTQLKMGDLLLSISFLGKTLWIGGGLVWFGDRSCSTEAFWFHNKAVVS